MPPKREISVESKAFSADKGAVASTHKSLPSSICIGQSCIRCEDKCRGGYVPHAWRKDCINCGCKRDYHQVFSSNDSLSFKDLKVVDDASGVPPEDKRKLELKYAWYPCRLTYDMVEKYMACLPKSSVPIKGSKAEKQRCELYSHQHPRHDISTEFCHDLSEVEKKRMATFVRKFTKMGGIGEVFVMTESNDKLCHGCSTQISQDSLYVTIEKESTIIWHPQCFSCSMCEELLVDLAYFYSLDTKEIYCGRHYVETFAKRCSGCDEVIFSSTYTEVNGKCWHKSHFCCMMCNMELHSKRFKEENGYVYCEECYRKFAAKKCQKCKESIGLDSKLVTIKEKSWHKECFVCKKCKVNLVSQTYYSQDDDLLCSECESLPAVAQCQGCRQGIKSTVSHLTHKNKHWHVECFKCTTCNIWLANGEFNEMDGNLMCNKCYIDKVSKKCIICQLPTAKGVQFGLNIYHSECFKCADCDASLLGGKVKEKNGQPFCQSCYLKGARKCYRCKGPITTRHTIYKGEPFHIECFKCNLCGSSIANNEFYETSLKEILCISCAQIA